MGIHGAFIRHSGLKMGIHAFQPSKHYGFSRVAGFEIWGEVPFYNIKRGNARMSAGPHLCTSWSVLCCHEFLENDTRWDPLHSTLLKKYTRCTLLRLYTRCGLSYGCGDDLMPSGSSLLSRPQATAGGAKEIISRRTWRGPRLFQHSAQSQFSVTKI